MPKFTHTNTGNKYARDVVSGRIDACNWVKLSCQRHLDDLKRVKDPAFPFKFDRAKANLICQFSQLLIHVKGIWAGQHVRLEPWQCFILATGFGWVRKTDGLRRFREIYAEIPRKNGKSVLGALIGLYMFAEDQEFGAEIYSGATTEKQAWEVFRPAKIMSEKTPEFAAHYGIQVNAQTLSCLGTSSRFEPLIGNPGDGASPHCAIIDEYHEHKTSDQYDTMLTGMGARTQPMMIVITTAGINLAGPCYDKRDQVCRVLSGTIDNDELFGIIYTLDEGDDWEDFDNWKKANPNYGVSVFEDFLRARHKESMQRASRQNIIRCKNLNQWMNANTAWMNMTALAKCKNEAVSINDFRGKPCWIGIDLASKVDIAAMVILFHQEGKVFLFGRYYLPRETVDMPENQYYQTWELMGRLNVTEGAVTDYSYIEDDLDALASDFEIQEVAYDPFQATEFSTRMSDRGFTMVEMRPTVLNFSEPMKKLEALVLSGQLVYDGDPVLTWMFSNTVAHTDRKDNIYPNKDLPQNKIDGVVAAIMALGRSTVPEEISVYEDRGVVAL